MSFALLPLSFITGTLSAAWTVSNQQHLLLSAPKENRSFYISAHNFTNGLLMAAGPLIGGVLADQITDLELELAGRAALLLFPCIASLGFGRRMCGLAHSAGRQQRNRGEARPLKRSSRGRCCKLDLYLPCPAVAELPAPEPVLDEHGEVATL